MHFPLPGAKMTVTGMPVINAFGFTDILNSASVPWLYTGEVTWSGSFTEGYGGTITLTKFHAFAAGDYDATVIT
jgi:hypothetical protein